MASSLIMWTAEASGANRQRLSEQCCTLSTCVQRLKHDAIAPSLIGVGTRQVACLGWPLMMVPNVGKQQPAFPAMASRTPRQKPELSQTSVCFDTVYKRHYLKLPHDNLLVTVLLGLSLPEDSMITAR